MKKKEKRTSARAAGDRPAAGLLNGPRRIRSDRPRELKSRPLRTVGRRESRNENVRTNSQVAQKNFQRGDSFRLQFAQQHPHPSASSGEKHRRPSESTSMATSSLWATTSSNPLRSTSVSERRIAFIFATPRHDLAMSRIPQIATSKKGIATNQQTTLDRWLPTPSAPTDRTLKAQATITPKHRNDKTAATIPPNDART